MIDEETAGLIVITALIVCVIVEVAIELKWRSRHPNK